MEMTYTETLVVTSCWCGISLAIPSNLHRYAKDKKNHAIFCPLGHEFVFGNTNEEKLKEAERKLEEERRRTRAARDLLHAEERSHSATKGNLTKVKKRVANGVCPHCNRTFQNVQRHMKIRHPEECSH